MRAKSPPPCLINRDAPCRQKKKKDEEKKGKRLERKKKGPKNDLPTPV